MNEAMRSPCHSCIKDRFDNGILDPSCGHIAGSRSQIVEAQNYAAKATKCHKTIHWLTPPSSICEDDRCTPIHRLHRQRFRCASFGLRLKPGTQSRFGEIGSLHIYTCVNRNAYLWCTLQQFCPTAQTKLHLLAFSLAWQEIMLSDFQFW